MNVYVKKNKIYGFIRVLLLMFQQAPRYAIVLILLRIISIITPIIRIYMVTYLIINIQKITFDASEIVILWNPLIAILIIELIGGITTVISQGVTKRCTLYLNLTQSPNIVHKISKLEISNFENNETMDLISRVKKNYVTKIVSAFVTTLYFIETILVALSIVLILTTQIGIWSITLLLVSIPLIVAGQKSGRELFEGEQELEKHKRYMDYLESLYLGREASNERNLFRFTKKISNIWKSRYETSNKINKQVKIRSYLRICSSSLLTFAGYISSIGFLCWFLIKGAITYALFTSIVIAILRLMHTLSYSLSWDISEMGRAIAFANDFSVFLELKETKESDTDPKSMDDFIFENLEFDNVTFKYPNAKEPILKDLSFKIKKGLRYAFVGDNGAGKTTIIKLLLRFYEPTKGEIRINGRPLAEYNYSQLKALFSVVFQDYAKYELTLYESITLGKPKANEKEVLKTLEFVGFYNFAHSFLNKELGKLSEDSIELSEGQYQRLAIARAALSNHQILILDEATSSIDPIQERDLYSLFNKTTIDKTTLFITHRLGSAKFVDCIFVINKGNIVEKGTHNDLLKMGGIYTKMYNSQKRWYE